jgi:hypothetical protein
MTLFCYPVAPAIGEDLLQTTSLALSARPNETAHQAASRTLQMVHTVMGMMPRDGLEVVISTIAYGHHGMILDSMRDVYQEPELADRRKAKSEVISLNRTFLGLLREYRAYRSRPEAAEYLAALAAAQPPAQKPEAAPPPEPQAEAPAVPAAVDSPSPAAPVAPKRAPLAAAPSGPTPSGGPGTGARTGVPPTAPMAAPMAAPTEPPMAPPAGSPAGAQMTGAQMTGAQPVRPVSRP